MGAAQQSSRSPRRYDSPLRRDQAVATRRRIRDSAAQLFGAQGYARTTIAAIADDAGVSPESVYGAFGTKSQLLWAVFEHAVSGADEATPVVDADLVDLLASEPEQRRRLSMMTDRTRGVLDRTAALDEMVKVAAHGDPTLRDLEETLSAHRRSDVEALVALLADAGPLRVPRAEAVDLIWAVATSDLYLRLRRGCGWPAARVDDLVEDLIARMVLPDPPLSSGAPDDAN